MSTIIATLVSTIIANVLFGAATDEMWVLFNAVQLIFVSLALKLFYTLHVQVMFSFLSFVNMENQYLAWVFLLGVKEQELSDTPLNDRFEAVGYGSTSVLINAAEVLATWQVAIILLIVFACLKPNPTEESGRCSFVMANLFKKSLYILLHDTIIRTFLEVFLDLFLSCVIDL